MQSNPATNKEAIEETSYMCISEHDVRHTLSKYFFLHFCYNNIVNQSLPWANIRVL